MDCKSVDCNKICNELVFLWADNEMGEEMLLAFERHISRCPHCAKTTQHTKLFLTMVRKRCTRLPVPGDLKDKILARMRHRRVIPVR